MSDEAGLPKDVQGPFKDKKALLAALLLRDVSTADIRPLSRVNNKERVRFGCGTPGCKVCFTCCHRSCFHRGNQYSVSARCGKDGLWRISSFEWGHSTCLEASTPERAENRRKRALSGGVIKAMLDVSDFTYVPVQHAHNSRALQRTIQAKLGKQVKLGVARNMLDALEGTSTMSELSEYAMLPSLFDHLRNEDTDVRSLL